MTRPKAPKPWCHFADALPTVEEALTAKVDELKEALGKATKKAVNEHKQMLAIQKTLAETQAEMAKQVKLKVKLTQAVAALPKPQAFAVFAGFAALTENTSTLNTTLPDIVIDTAKWEGKTKMNFACCIDCGWANVGTNEDTIAASNAHAKAEHKGKHGMGAITGWSTEGYLSHLLPKWWNC